MENWYGIPMKKPLTRMKEYVDIMRQIFTTGHAQLSGEFYQTTYAFMGYSARPDLPIYVSALAPNMLRWAGAKSDGVILWGCLPSYIEKVVTPTVRAGAEEAGRDPDAVEIVAAIPTALTADVAAAYDALRTEFYTYMMLPFYRRAIDGAGYGAEIKAFDEANALGNIDAAKKAMSEAMLSEFAAFGDEAAIEKKFQQYRDAGVTLPAVGAAPVGAGSPGVDATLEAAIA
jgi:alkanesulfonate monooxygenase SsuD/methylene tetrahydromethanopterin reductase-like flavin-dependent oxidoreductase (luciferase family)